jgi:hypothetical protein
VRGFDAIVWRPAEVRTGFIKGSFMFGEMLDLPAIGVRKGKLWERPNELFLIGDSEL